MDREGIYNALWKEISLYKGSTEGYVYHENEIALLTRMSTLTDAVLYEKLSLVEARASLRDYIQSLRTASGSTPAAAEEAGPGTIKF